MCETKLIPDIKDSEFLPTGYTSVTRKDRTRAGGGVLIATKSTIVAEEVALEGINVEVVFTKLALANNRTQYLGCFYNNDGSLENYDQLDSALEQISNLAGNNKNSGISIGGDFNAPGVDWNNFMVTSDCPRKGACQHLLDILNKHGLTQLQTESTHRDGSILDLFTTNKPGLIKSCKTIPGISDHHIVVIDSTARAHYTKKPPRKIYKWKKANWEDIKESARKFCEEYITTEGAHSVASNHTKILEFFKTCQSKIPSSMTKTRTDLPWMSPELKRNCRRNQRLYNKAKKSGRPDDKKRYQDARKSFQTQLKNAHWQYVNDMLRSSLEDGDSKPFYRYIKSKREDNVGVSPLKEDGKLHVTAVKKCEILARQFRSVFTNDNDDPQSDVLLHGPSYPPIEELIITDTGVAKLLADINPSKASGPDEIPCRLLKELAQELAPVFASPFRQSIHTGDLPSSWLHAWITPVFKKGPRCEPENYRPVSLTCVM